MSSILNSILAGELQVQKAPEVKPVKEDSIIDLLQNSEIEFETCPKLEEKEFSFDTGFGEDNDLHYETKCKKPDLKTPLYKENCLAEFTSEEEKAAARHALGLYNKGDIVAMSLLTAEDTNPTKLNWEEIPVKELRKGDKPFVPITSFSAVCDSSGISLTTHFKNIQTTIKEHQKAIIDITKISNLKQITSLGDVKSFLEGFNNGDNLKEQLDTINQDMLRFEKSGQIND